MGVQKRFDEPEEPQCSSSGAPHTGTTIMAVEYAGGVVLGADSRVSTGIYVSNRASNKIAPLCDNVYLCRSGSAADTQAVCEIVKHAISQHEMDTGTPPSVLTVARLVTGINYQNKHLSAAMIVAGVDAKGTPAVFGAPIGGTLKQQPWAIDGSGSTYIWSLADALVKPNLSREAAEAAVATCLSAAMHRDGSSGGLIRLVTIDSTTLRATHRVIQGEALPNATPGTPLVPVRRVAA